MDKRGEPRCLRDGAAPGRFTALGAGRLLRDAPRGGAEPPDDVAKVFAANLDRYFRGEPLLYEVDWGKGY